MKLLLLSAFLIFQTAASQASEQLYYETHAQDLTEHELAMELSDLDSYEPIQDELDQRGLQTLQLATDMASLGVSVIDLFYKNKPTVSTDFAPLHVLPRDKGRIVGAGELRLVPGTRAVRYSISGKSRLGKEVVKFTYTLIYQAGIYKNGRYILNAFFKTSTRVGWGNNFEAKSRYMGMANVGTKAAPVAQATVKITYKVSNLLISDEHDEIIRFDAKGRVTEL